MQNVECSTVARPNLTLQMLCPEVRDAIFEHAATTQDAHAFNDALQESRAPSVWSKLVAKQLPAFTAKLEKAEHQALAAHVSQAPDYQYGDAGSIWDKMDTARLMEAAAVLTDTGVQRDLRGALLDEMTWRATRAYEETIDKDALPPSAMSDYMLQSHLSATLCNTDADAEPGCYAHLKPHLTLYLDGITALPDVLSCFHHVTQLTLKKVGNHVDLSVLKTMRAQDITLHLEKGASIRLPTSLTNKCITIRHA